MRSAFVLALLVAVQFSWQNSWAREIRLFDAGSNISPTYEKSILAAEPGDVFIFSDGTEMTVIKKIRAWADDYKLKTFIFEARNKQGVVGALRLPTPFSRHFINLTIKGYKTLVDSHLPVTRILDRGLPREYAFFDLLPGNP